MVVGVIYPEEAVGICLSPQLSAACKVLKKDNAMEAKLIYVEPVQCVGLSEDLDMPRDKERIPALWAKLQSRMSEINRISGPAMGIVRRSSKAECIRYSACMRVENAMDLPGGLEAVTVPAGNYAEFVHRGPVSTLFKTCDDIYRSWFPQSGYTAGNGPMVEIYPQNFKGNEENPEIRILVSVNVCPG
jgi:predicted transcriptional regulator YdeE